MSSKGKLVKWANENIVMLVGIPLIIGIHYGWSNLQKVPYLVDQSKEKDFPIIGAYKSITNKLWQKFGESSDDEQHKEEEKIN